MADVDRMRAEIGDGWKHGDSSARAALVCRYCGLRIAQVVNLRWRDVRLDGGAAGPYIVIHAHTRGAKKGRTRVLPLHPALAAEMAGWGVREGRVFPSTNNYWITGEAAREAMTTAWESSGVDRAVWDIPDDEEGKRSHGSPTHGIRAAVFTTLLREGTAYDVACYAVGQATTATRAAYVPENAPEASPWWVPLVAAVAKIPDHRETDNVVTLAARGR
jgi:integrase